MQYNYSIINIISKLLIFRLSVVLKLSQTRKGTDGEFVPNFFLTLIAARLGNMFVPSLHNNCEMFNPVNSCPNGVSVKLRNTLPIDLVFYLTRVKK